MSLVLPAQSPSVTTQREVEDDGIELSAVVVSGGANEATDASNKTPQQKRSPASKRERLVTVVVDGTTAADPSVSNVESWARRVSGSLTNSNATSSRHTVCAFSFAQRSSLAWLGMGRSGRQKQAKTLDTLGSDLVKTLRLKFPPADLNIVQHVDSASASLEDALSSYTPSPSQRSDGDINLIVTPYSRTSSWTWYVARGQQEGFLRSNAVKTASPTPRSPSSSSIPVLIVKDQVWNESAALYSSTDVSTPSKGKSAAQSKGIAALACVNLKHFREGAVPATARACAEYLLHKGDSLQLFAHVEMPTAGDSVYATDTQWTHSVKDIIDAANEQLKMMTEAVQSAYPHLKVGALKSENHLIPGVQHAVEKHNISIVAVGRGSRARVLGSKVHGMLSSVAREQYESLIAQVEVPGILLV